MMNKKGIATAGIIIAIVGILALGLVLFSTGALGMSSLTSETAKIPTYSKASCPDLGLKIEGNVNVEDKAIFDLEPGIKKIDVESVTSGGQSLLAFGEEPFTYTVKGFDSSTNQKIGGTYSGTGNLKKEDNQGIDVPYVLSYKIPDNNCDKKIDDFTLKIVAELKGADIASGFEKQTKLLKFKNGRVS
tara:strand:- start:604 stop:1167 length:564 start_codon:yes stop_codon:yes gene_type:complete